MTVSVHHQVGSEIATDDDLRVAALEALEVAGCSYEELRRHAELDDFATLRQRLAWNVVRNLADLVE